MFMIKVLTIAIAVSSIISITLFAVYKIGDKETDNPSVVISKQSDEIVVCPVCGLEFMQREAIGEYTVDGRTYYFYLEDHLKVFKDSPVIYLAK